MATREQILEELRGLAKPFVLTSEQPRLDSRLIEDLGLDSIALLSLVVGVENRFEIALGPEEEAKIETLGDLVEVIASFSDP